MKCVFQYMYPKSLLETSTTVSTACISLFIVFPDFTLAMLYPPHSWYPPNCMKYVFQYMYPRSLSEASTASTASTAYTEGPVTPYIHALNAVDAVEPSNVYLGYIYWKTHFIQLGGWGVPPITPTPK